MMGRSSRIAPDRTSPRCLVIATLLMRMRARPNPPSCWPCSWSIRREGTVNAARKMRPTNVGRVADKTIVIPGHGPVGNKSQLIGFRDTLVSVREKVSALKKEGKSLEEVVAAKPTADYDPKWGGFVINGNFFTKLVHAGV